MVIPYRPCIDCGRLITRGSRCAEHLRAYEQRRGTANERGYDYAYQQLRKQVLFEEPSCRQCGTTENLTVDHIKPLSAFPLGMRHLANVRENLQTLCEFHNKQKGGV